MDMTVFKLTDEAKNQMTKMLEKNPGNYAVGLAVLGGGCAGFKYDWQLIKTKEEVTQNIQATLERNSKADSLEYEKEKAKLTLKLSKEIGEILKSERSLSS